MINPEFQGNIEEWTEVKLKEEDQPLKRITTFPKLINFLVKYQWINKGGNPKWEEMAQKLRLELQQRPETLLYSIDVIKHHVKIHMPIENKKRAVLTLKIPRSVKFLCLAEQPLRLAPTMDDVERLSDCSGSMKNYCSSDDILTEFEIEETVEMVRKWIKKKWYVPSNQNAVILLDTSSDSEDSAGATKLLVQKLRKHRTNKSPERSLTPPTPPTIRRQVPNVGKYALFCDDSATDDSVDSILL
ncbi:MAG: hypothetical protein CL859_05855 [Cyanobium sp. ARS6]|nr:hypothetical protein [Cyanobium sp. ARS6]